MDADENEIFNYLKSWETSSLPPVRFAVGRAAGGGFMTNRNGRSRFCCA